MAGEEGREDLPRAHLERCNRRDYFVYVLGVFRGKDIRGPPFLDAPGRQHESPQCDRLRESHLVSIGTPFAESSETPKRSKSFDTIERRNLLNTHYGISASNGSF